MRQTLIFSGSSHPALVDLVCERLGMSPAPASLGKFANGETKVELHESIRDKDVFIIQSGTNKINDDVLELLIMISACSSGSARSVTAVMPYYPYSRQSKKKSHRGCITARMVANLLHVAGVDHVITIDLHASQMQGFFHCPVDNLVAEPLLAHWIKRHIPEYRKGVVVSKNPGGTKRVASLADALKISIGVVITDQRPQIRSLPPSTSTSLILERSGSNGNNFTLSEDADANHTNGITSSFEERGGNSPRPSHMGFSTPVRRRTINSNLPSSPLSRHPPVTNNETAAQAYDNLTDDDADDGPPRDIITGRLLHGHIVDEDAPSSNASVSSATNLNGRPHGESDDEEPPEGMFASVMSMASSARNIAHNALGGSADAAASSDDEEEMFKNPEYESTVTFVGNVKDKIVFIVDDMIDKPASWIAAAETVVKRGGAVRVYCMATHGLFGDDCLEEMANCDCIDNIVVTNALPLTCEISSKASNKLVVLDVSSLLSEAIRRNHHGESISRLFEHSD